VKKFIFLEIDYFYMGKAGVAALALILGLLFMVALYFIMIYMNK